MRRYARFAMYWESWGGYAHRAEPFQDPRLVRVLASSAVASVTVIDGAGSGAHRSVPLDVVEPWPGLLTELGAFATPVSFVRESDEGDGDYVVVEDVTGVLDDRPFHLSLEYVPVAQVLTPAGFRLRAALAALLASA